MNRLLQHGAFALGLLAIAWVATGYLPGNPLALVLLLPIAAAFVLGTLELRRFQQATQGLAAVLDATTQTPATLADWLAQLPPSLRQAVRLRVQGERVALPGPALTPYLAGLLVLLGMLGTFLGMVVTLKGTGLALENASDVEAIRSSLAVPVKGLGLAFGTSVAGVAASAMLGLMSALARRERQRCAQRLDDIVEGPLQAFSHRFAQDRQREQALQLQQAQAGLMPALVQQLQQLATQLGQHSQALHERLLDGQARFQTQTQRDFQALAESVDRSLKASLADSARLAGAAIEPAVHSTLAGLARESEALRQTLAGTVQQQLAGFADSFDQRSAQLVDRVATRLDQAAADSSSRWGQAAADLHQGQAALLQHTQAAVQATVAAFEQQAGTLLQGLAQTLQQQARQGDEALLQRQQQICDTLEATAQAITTQAESQARATLAEVGQLMQAAAEAPRRAAQVIGELRSALSDSLARDNAALQERQHLLATLGGLLDTVNHASTEQRAAIDQLVQASRQMLEQAGSQFAGAVAQGAQGLQAAATQVSDSAAGISSLGERFGSAVQQFSQASQALMAQLQGIEAALGHSLARSDEQLAYYVAQAREIVDLTLGSHKQMVDDLQQLARSPALAAPAPESAAA